jgi:hypothetical protein
VIQQNNKTLPIYTSYRGWTSERKLPGTCTVRGEEIVLVPEHQHWKNKETNTPDCTWLYGFERLYFKLSSLSEDTITVPVLYTFYLH